MIKKKVQFVETYAIEASCEEAFQDVIKNLETAQPWERCSGAGKVGNYSYSRLPGRVKVEPKIRGIKVTREPKDFRDIAAAHCCFCRAPTRYWYTPKGVAVCIDCAMTHNTKDVPSEKEWCDKEMAIAKAEGRHR